MTAQQGSKLYISDGTGTSAVAIAALQTSEFTINGKPVDVTNRDSAGYQELLSGAGVVSMTIKGDGVLGDETIFGTMIDRGFSRSVDPYTINFGGTETLSGNFQLTSFDGKGPYNANQTYSFQLESSGSIARA